MSKKRRNQNFETWKVLNEDMPQIFDMRSPKPLAKGFANFVEITYPQITSIDRRRFFYWWCSRKEYLEAVSATDSYRFLHTMKVQGPVTDRDRLFAKAKLSKLFN